MNYALYLQYALSDYYTAYIYYLESFSSGYKKAGHHIGYIQLKHKEIFDKEIFSQQDKPDIDESIYYLQEAFKAGAVSAAAQLTAIYREPQYNRVNYKKSEYLRFKIEVQRFKENE